VAVDLIERALRFAPDAGAYWSNLTETLRVLGRLAEAIDAGRRAVALTLDAPDAQNNLGIALLNAGDLMVHGTQNRLLLKVIGDIRTCPRISLLAE